MNMVIENLLPGLGKLNAAIKNMMKQTGESDPEEAVRLFNSGQFRMVPTPHITPRVNWVGNITTSATTGKFVVKEKFRVNSREIKFHEIQDVSSCSCFADVGKIEGRLGEQTLRYGDIVRMSNDSQLIAGLGGEVKVETTFTELYDVLKGQPYGEKGVLLTNHCVNIFYVRDVTGDLCSALVNYLQGWLLRMYHLDYMPPWGHGCRVFTRVA